MQFFTSLFIVVSLAFTVISTPVLEKDSSLAARGFTNDIDARALDESLIFSRARIIKGLEARAEDVEDIERRATNNTKTFSTLKQQLSVVSNTAVTLQSAVFQLSSTPSFDQIVGIYDHLNTFISSSQAVYKSMKTLQPVKTNASASAILELVKPLVGSVNVSVQGLVNNKNVFLNCGIGCIIEFLLALILFILAAILEIIIILISCNSVCVQELQSIQTDCQTSIKAAIAAFST